MARCACSWAFRRGVTSRKLQTRPTIFSPTRRGREYRSKVRPSLKSRTSWLSASGFSSTSVSRAIKASGSSTWERMSLMTGSSLSPSRSSGGMPHILRNWSLNPATPPSELITRMPSAVDSRVAVSSDMASRRSASAAFRCEVLRMDTSSWGPSADSSKAPASSAANSVPSLWTPYTSRGGIGSRSLRCRKICSSSFRKPSDRRTRWSLPTSSSAATPNSRDAAALANRMRPSSAIASRASGLASNMALLAADGPANAGRVPGLEVSAAAASSPKAPPDKSLLCRPESDMTRSPPTHIIKCGSGISMRQVGSVSCGGAKCRTHTKGAVPLRGARRL